MTQLKLFPRAIKTFRTIFLAISGFGLICILGIYAYLFTNKISHLHHQINKHGYGAWQLGFFQVSNKLRSDFQIEKGNLNQVLDNQLRSLSGFPQVPDDQKSSLGGFHQVSDDRVFIYSGFIDIRHKKSFLRLFGMQSQDIGSTFYCQLHLPTGVTLECPVKDRFTIYKQWPSPDARYLAYDYACVLPENWTQPKKPIFSRIYSEKKRNRLSDLWLLPVGQNYKDRESLAVCVKGIWGSVNPLRLIEWLEFNKILGVQKVVFYDSLTLGEAVKVMKYYEATGFVDIIPFNYAQQMALLTQDDPLRRQLSDDQMVLEQAYLVSINDCYYRYRDRYKYVMILDIDEVIVPARNESLLDVIRAADSEFPSATAFSFNTAWHLEEYGESDNGESDDQSQLLHMQKYLYRSVVMNSQPKSIINTDRCINVNWHGTVAMPSDFGYYGNKVLPWEQYGFVHHYRKRCKHDKYTCEDMANSKVKDKIIPNYMNRLIKEVSRVATYLEIS